MKNIYIIFTLLMLATSACRSPYNKRSDLDTLKLLNSKLQSLRVNSTTVKYKDPIFTKWLKNQYEIMSRISQNIQRDIEDNQQQIVQSELEDFRLLLKRTKEEIEYIKVAPNLEKNGQLNVRDFGAKGDGIHDDSWAISKAIDAALAGDIRKVFLPKGIYLVKYNPANKKPYNQWDKSYGCVDDFHPSENNGAIVIQGKNLLLTGEQGTELLCDGPQDTAIQIIGSENVQIRNLKINYTKLACTSGVITAVNGDDKIESIDVKFSGNYPDPTSAYFREKGFKGLCRFYSKELLENNIRPAISSVAMHQIAPKVRLITPNVYRFQFRKPAESESLHIGQHMTYYARSYTNHAIVDYCSSRTRIDQVTLTNSPAISFCLFNSQMPFITNCTVTSESGRYTSTAADGFYLKSGYGGYIANNALRHISDDFINIHSRLAPVISQEGRAIFLPLKIWPEKFWKEFKRLGIILSSKGESGIRQEVGIEKYEIIPALKEDKNSWMVKVTCDQDIPELTGKTDLKSGQVPDVISAPDYEWHGLVISDNKFEHGVSRVLVGGRNINITGNTFIDTVQAPSFVVAGMEPVTKSGGESRFPRNILFSENFISANAKSIFNFSQRICHNQNTKHVGSPYNTTHFFINYNKIILNGNCSAPVFVLKDLGNIEITDNSIISASETKVPLFKVSNTYRAFIKNNSLHGSYDRIIQNDGDACNILNINNIIEADN